MAKIRSSEGLLCRAAVRRVWRGRDRHRQQLSARALRREWVPGYFPRMLGILLIVLGAALSLARCALRGTPLPGWKWRPVS